MSKTFPIDGSISFCIQETGNLIVVSIEENGTEIKSNSKFEFIRYPWSTSYNNTKYNSGKQYGNIPKNYFHSLKRSASRRGIGFFLTIDYLWKLNNKQKGCCALSGIPISFKDKNMSLDRIDSNLPYMKGNVQWVHTKINKMKWDLTQETFIELCRKISNKNTDKKYDTKTI